MNLKRSNCPCPDDNKNDIRPRDFFDRLRAIPQKPGVYLMKDKYGAVLYVGKAARLRSRVGSYFANSANHLPKVRILVTKVADYEFIVTESEQEALLLEATLIKKHKPLYNVRLKDDKSYPFIKIDRSEDFPQVLITRSVSRDNSTYFGPYASVHSVRRTLNLLKRLFPYRSCTKAITGNDERPCLDYYIQRCVAPCIGAVNKDEYADIIDSVSLFLEGKTDLVVKGLSVKMTTAADNLEFEKAAAFRDQLKAIEKVNEGQKVLHIKPEDLDVIAVAPAQQESWIEIFFIRQGKLIGRDNFIMHSKEEETSQDLVTAFVKQFYDSNSYVPNNILTQHPLTDCKTIERWLSGKRHGKVNIVVPQRGEKRRLVQMVAENAFQGLAQLKIRQQSDTSKLDEGMIELEDALSLPRPPRRIECYDISNIQGAHAVGSMIVFEDGKPKPSHYRRFQIKNVQGINDYLMMQEMLTRRFRRISDIESKDGSISPNTVLAKPTVNSRSWGVVPDLVLIDGGKGHMSAALEVFLQLGINHIPLASIAKENEEVFVPHMQEGILLPRNSQGLYLLQRARDEAHRFAVTFHRQLRSKRGVASKLDLIPGIGLKRRKMLIRRFGSVKGIRGAGLDEIAAVPGMTMKLARTIAQYI